MARSYGLDCPVAKALDIIGERWALLIVRDLLFHPERRFQDFIQSLDGLTPAVLSARLKTLQDYGLIERRIYSDHPLRAAYSLSEKGRALGPIVRSLRDFGRTLPADR